MASCGGTVHVPVPQEPDARAACAQATSTLPIPYCALLYRCTRLSYCSGHDEQISHTHSVAVLNRAAFHLANAKWRAVTYPRNKRACKRRTGSETVSE